MIVVVGVSHKTAPIELREQVALSEEGASALCAELARQPEVAETFVVSTCNRVEVVAVPTDGIDASACAKVCTRLLCRGHPELERLTYVRQGVSGMRHLVRVAASLDSLVVGEPQILGQLKAGFQLAREQGTVGATLHRAFSAAVRGAKRVRSETNIGAGQVSVPSIAVQLASQIFGDLRGHRVVLVGSGEMGKAVASLFADQGAKLVVVGRSLEKVRALTDEIGGQPVLMDALTRVLVDADVVVSSTSAPGPVITLGELKQTFKARRGRNLFLIDLAVPRDVEPAVGELDGVFLYNVDDLSQVANESTEARKREAERAAELVEGIVERWERSRQAEQATPVLKALRARMGQALQLEMQRSLRGRLRDLDEGQRAALQKMLESGVNRILHAPTTRIREEAGRGGLDSVDDVLSMLSELFELAHPDLVGEGDSLPPERVTRRSSSLGPEDAAGAATILGSPANLGSTAGEAKSEAAVDAVGVAEGSGEPTSACARARY